MSYSIEGRTAIVTGAAHGLGLAIARHFADEGANVMFADIDEARLEHEVGAAAEKEANIRFFGGDLRQKLTVANLISATIDAFDRVDILVNAARQCVTTDPLSAEDGTVEELLQQNVIAGLRLSQAVARRMIAQAEKAEEEPRSAGAIVNLSSIAAQRTQPQLMAYSISAAAVDQMTRSLALSLAPHRIRVNAVAFGSVMSASLQTQIKDHADWRSEIRSHTPLGRIAAPGELAEAVQFLASEAASFLTGQVITVDGGRTLIDAVAAPAH
jgi:7-alpha-hydroxysteroid dehydrogenase